MPLYDFTCDDCGKSFDKLFRTVPQRPEAACPACGSAKTRRALSLVNAGKGRGKAAAASEGPMCGRCGGPGPCAMDG